MSPNAQAKSKLRLGRLGLVGLSILLTVALGVLASMRPSVEPATDLKNVAATAAVTAGVTAQKIKVAQTLAPEPKPRSTPSVTPPTAAKKAVAPPAQSGVGRRIVFDQSEQRVWLVEDRNRVVRTYLVSGSRFDNLQPGTYRVQSKQRNATSFDYSGTMEYFVRFATGYRAPIGFHSIPVYNNGKPEQSVKDLGKPLSAGCVRQEISDAKFLWDWAPIGTTVVVTA